MADLEGVTISGRYFLRRKVGSGGMADVYEAWDQLRNTQMAVKTLRYDKEFSPERIEAFEKEAEWLEKLEHPYIVRLYELGYLDDLVYLVMDWVDGMDLRRHIRLRGKPFPPDEIARILHPVCIALHYTHQRKVYHCDVKPANILLAQDGRVLLTDFGVAQLSYERRGGGTPLYMAPEQVLEKPVDARSDVYGLGVTLFEMLTGGALPYRGESQQSRGVSDSHHDRIRWEHVHLPLPPVTDFNPDAPAPLIRVIERALQKDPDLRYASAMEFWIDLEQACAEAITQIKPPPPIFPSSVEKSPPLPVPPASVASPVKQSISPFRRFLMQATPLIITAIVGIIVLGLLGISFIPSLIQAASPASSSQQQATEMTLSTAIAVVHATQTAFLRFTQTAAAHLNDPGKIGNGVITAQDNTVFACMGKIMEDTFIADILRERFRMVDTYYLYQCQASTEGASLKCLYSRMIDLETYTTQQPGEWVLIPGIGTPSECDGYIFSDMTGKIFRKGIWAQIHGNAP